MPARTIAPGPSQLQPRSPSVKREQDKGLNPGGGSHGNIKGQQVAQFIEQTSQRSSRPWSSSSPSTPTVPLSSLFTQSSCPIFLPDILSSDLSLFSQFMRNPVDAKLFWKSQLVALLPSQMQCDLLVAYYIENIDWLYHAIHIPLFRRRYSAFWAGSIDEIDLVWLALLYTVISITALMAPVEQAQVMGFEHSKLRVLSHVWHQASRQALHAGEFESKPCLVQLQVFLATQLYWLETKNVESLNSALGQAVRNAQALGLDKNTPGANCLDTELRRRAWWDLCVADTFQSMCLDRTPLIHTPLSKVPMPVNCNDTDVTATSIIPRPMEVPTDMSALICRVKAFRIFRKLYFNDGAYLSSYSYIQSIDKEIQTLIAEFPWYFRIGSEESLRHLPTLDSIAWQHESLHICICLQRIRMNRPFLHARIGESWGVCFKAAQEMLAPYRRMREVNVERFRQSQKFLIQGYQSYTAAVTLAAFLLVERSLPGFSSEFMRHDIEMVISDLELKDLGPLISDGIKILRKMLDMFDQRRDTRDPHTRESLVRDIASVFGGEQPTRRYLKQCDIGYVLNNTASSADGSSSTGNTPTAQTTGGSESAIAQSPGLVSLPEPTGPDWGVRLPSSVSVLEPVDMNMVHPGFSLTSDSEAQQAALLDANVPYSNQIEFMPDDLNLALDMLDSDQWWDILPEITFQT